MTNIVVATTIEKDNKDAPGILRQKPYCNYENSLGRGTVFVHKKAKKSRFPPP